MKLQSDRLGFLRSDDVAQRVVLLIQREQTGVGHFRVLVYADFFLSFKQKEGLEGGRSVHPDDVSPASAPAAVRMRRLAAILGGYVRQLN